MSELKRLKREYKLEVARKWIYISAFSFLLIIGMILLFLNTVYFHVTNQNHVEKVLDETKNISAQQIEGNKDVIEKLYNSESDITSKDSSKKISHNFDVINPVSSMTSDAVFNKDLVIGQLYIPDLERNLPILEGTSQDNLYNGASTLKPNQKLGEGNFALASLNISEKEYLFSNLNQVQEGHSIYATDKKMIYEYEISKISEINEDINQSIGDDESKIITLVTHNNNDEDSHIIIKADFKYSYSFDEATSELAQVFLPN